MRSGLFPVPGSISSAPPPHDSGGNGPAFLSSPFRAKCGHPTSSRKRPAEPTSRTATSPRRSGHHLVFRQPAPGPVVVSRSHEHVPRVACCLLECGPERTVRYGSSSSPTPGMTLYVATGSLKRPRPRPRLTIDIPFYAPRGGAPIPGRRCHIEDGGATVAAAPVRPPERSPRGALRDGISRPSLSPNTSRACNQLQGIINLPTGRTLLPSRFTSPFVSPFLDHVHPLRPSLSGLI